MVTRHKDSLWVLITGPTVWTGYFMTVYVVAAVYCAKAESYAADLTPVRLLAAILGLASLAAIGLAAWLAWRRWRGAGASRPPYGDDTRDSREQFLAAATLLLCGLSFVATVYVALPAVFVASCG